MRSALFCRLRFFHDFVFGLRLVNRNSLCRFALSAVAAILGAVSVTNVIQDMNENAILMKMTPYHLTYTKHVFGGDVGAFQNSKSKLTINQTGTQRWI